MSKMNQGVCSRRVGAGTGLALACLAASGASSALWAGDGYLVVESINENSDIAGWYTYADGDLGSVAAIPFIITEDEETRRLRWLPGSSGDLGSRALASARNDSGALLVCGYLQDSSNPIVSRQPQLWYVECEQVIAISVSEEYLGGMFLDVVADDENERWIVVGEGILDTKSGGQVVGATTFTLDYDFSSDPIDSKSRFGPIGAPDFETRTTPCFQVNAWPCEVQDIEGTTNLAWAITKAAGAADAFHTAGTSNVVNLFNEYGCTTTVLGFQDTLLNNDLQMPVQDRFLVDPANWSCSNEELPDGCPSDGLLGSVQRMSAFDVLGDGSVCGGMTANVDVDPSVWKSRPFWRHPDLHGTAVELPMIQSIEAVALQGTTLLETGERHFVGFEQVAGSQLGDPMLVSVSRMNRGLFANRDHAVEWISQGSSMVVHDLNDSRADVIPDNVTLVSASDINSSGLIIGMAYEESNQPFAYLLTRTQLINLDDLQDAPGVCVADLNGDDDVNGGDLGLVLASWGVWGACLQADINGDRTVSGADLGMLLSQWGPCN